MTNKILGLAALAEAGTGALLVVSPPVVVRLLFGTEIGGVSVTLARLTGIALIGLSVACWPSKTGLQPLYGMLTYSTLATLYLICIGIRGAAVGALLWPAVVVHAAICVLVVWTWSSNARSHD